jgi:TRAP transporter 4TM/12TM fusion protein
VSQALPGEEGLPPKTAAAPLRLVGLAASAGVSAFILATTLRGSFSIWVQYEVVLALVLTAVFSLWPGPLARYAPQADLALSILLIAGSASAAIYMIANHHEISAYRQGLPSRADLIVYAIGTLVVLEGVRRAEGRIIPIIVAVTIAYLLAGPYLPGILSHRGHDLEQTLELAYSEQGIFGVALGSIVEIVYIYVIFGVTLRVTGAGEFFDWVAGALTFGRRSGSAQCAIIASALFGSINGSAPANVVANGHITINMMHRAGYSRAYAAAVEASSSVVGQIMPPVMGVGAFIMSEITGIPYANIMLAALVPSFLFIFSLAVVTALEAAKLGLSPLEMSRDPMTSHRLAQLVVVTIGFGLLVYMLLAGYSVDLAGLCATVAVVGLSAAVPSMRPSPGTLLRILVDGGREGLSVAVSCAAIGIIVGAVSATGLGIKISQAIIALGAANLFLALVLAALCTLLLGLSLPTAASYLMVVFIVGPALTKLGISTLAAHMFIFYYAVLSAITPPVSLAVFAAAAIAQVPAYKIEWIAMRLCIVAFLFPFLWVYQPELMLQNPSAQALPSVIAACASLTFAVVLMAAVQVGYFRGRLAAWERIALAGSAALIYWPETFPTVIGATVGAVLLARRLFLSRSSGETTSQPASETKVSTPT